MSRFLKATDSFRVRTEDRALVLRAGEADIVCVADGSGGMSGAANAAEMFVSGVKRNVDAGSLKLTDAAAWVALLGTLDAEIARHPFAGETTGIALVVTPTTVVGASAGDSRAWLFADTANELTEEQVRTPRLGTGHAIPKPFTAPAHGTLVVGTDGLFDHASIDDIRAIALASPSPDAADALIGLLRARFQTLPDDVAVVVGWLD
jgi:serine/threonine protein phosphatase PrpC